MDLVKRLGKKQVKEQRSLNGTHFGMIKFDAKIYGSFEGLPLEICALFGVVSYNDPLRDL